MNGNLSGSVHWGEAAIRQGSGAIPLDQKFDGPGETSAKFEDRGEPVGQSVYHMAGTRADSPLGNE